MDDLFLKVIAILHHYDKLVNFDFYHSIITAGILFSIDKTKHIQTTQL